MFYPWEGSEQTDTLEHAVLRNRINVVHVRLYVEFTFGTIVVHIANLAKDWPFEPWAVM